jgi:L-alanine-DL-glutamate epimerase-like enolase superfamily enzyme
MTSRIRRIETFKIEIPRREEIYLGDLKEGEVVNEAGYFVRVGNRTVYPVKDRSVLVRIETADGTVGWGETYGIVAPGAVMAIVDDLFAGFLIGRDPFEVSVIYEDLYDLMRVRGYHSGYYHDALALVDIALWDICGKLRNAPVASLLGGQRHQSIPAYVSGLPGKSREDRAALAKSWLDKGFTQFKFASPQASDGVVAEFKTLRAALGETAQIAADLHWTLSDVETVALAHACLPYNPWFLEATCKPEDVEGIAEAARRSPVPIAAGEEWRTVFDVRRRLEAGPLAIIQPEMGHVGITVFHRMGLFAAAHHRQVIPHATIGIGIFLSASLQASAALQNVVGHEFQHTILARNSRYLDGDLTVENGQYRVSQKPGIGAEPSAEALKIMTK